MAGTGRRLQAEQFDVFVTIDRNLFLRPYFVDWMPMDGPAPGEARTGC
jgi:hypothetical protein